MKNTSQSPRQFARLRDVRKIDNETNSPLLLPSLPSAQQHLVNYYEETRTTEEVQIKTALWWAAGITLISLLYSVCRLYLIHHRFAAEILAGFGLVVLGCFIAILYLAGISSGRTPLIWQAMSHGEPINPMHISQPLIEGCNNHEPGDRGYVPRPAA